MPLLNRLYYSTKQALALQKVAGGPGLGLQVPSVARRAVAGFVAGALPGAVAGGTVGALTADKDENRLRRALTAAAVAGLVTGSGNALRHGLSQRRNNLMAESMFDTQYLPSVQTARVHRAVADAAEDLAFHTLSARARDAEARADFLRGHIQDALAPAPTYLERLLRRYPHTGAVPDLLRPSSTP